MDNLGAISKSMKYAMSILKKKSTSKKEIESLEKLEKKLAVEIVREIERTERGGIKKIVIKTRNRKNRKRNN